MKKILISLSVIFIIAAIVVGATAAYFSDTESSIDNTFTGGIFDIEIDGNSLPFKVWNILPGWSGYEIHGVQNVGSIAGEVWITAENFVDPSIYYGGYYAEPPEPPHSEDMTPEEFAKILYMKIEADLDGNHTYETEIYDGPIYDMESAKFSINPGEYIECEFMAYLPTDLDDPITPENETDNLYQADGVAADVIFYGTTEIEIQ